MSDPVAARPPGALIGFRMFRVAPNGMLTGVTVPAPWWPGVNVATHDGCPDAQGCPGAGCHCGLNAFSDPCKARGHFAKRGLVLAAVAGWGDVQAHLDGWRAQYAQVLAVCPDPTDPDITARAAKAAARHRVPVIDEDRIVDYALEHGRQLRDDERPPRPGPAASIRRRVPWPLLAPLAALVSGVAAVLTASWWLFGVCAASGTCAAFAARRYAPMAGPFVVLAAVTVGIAAFATHGAKQRQAADRTVGRIAALAADVQLQQIAATGAPILSGRDLVASNRELQQAARAADATVRSDASRRDHDVLITVSTPAAGGQTATARIPWTPGQERTP